MAQFTDFVHSASNDDQVLRSLMDLERTLTQAWKANPVPESVLGECAALAAATRWFYQESRR
jgi:hypothetical protein